jgi:hypothetical protein
VRDGHGARATTRSERVLRRLTPPGAVRDGGVPIPRSPLRLANQECVNASLPYEDAVSADALARTRRQSRSVAVLPALSGGALTAIRDLRRACLAIALVTQGFVFLVVLDAAAVFLCHIPSSAYRVSGHLQVWQPSFRCVPSSCGAHSAPAERRYGHGPVAITPADAAGQRTIARRIATDYRAQIV